MARGWGTLGLDRGGEKERGDADRNNEASEAAC